MQLHSPLICGTLLLVMATSNCCFVDGFQHPTHGYRRQMNQMRTMAQWAYQHGMRINEEAMCAKPRAELFYLSDNNKIYLPRATLLHRCSDLTGCCAHATHSCQPTQVETVNLYFFTISVQSRLRQNQNIEKISFVNHTECACLPLPVDQGRSESLRKNETFLTADNKVNTAMSEHSVVETNDNSSSDDARAAMYNGDSTGGEGTESNHIDINSGMSEQSDSSGNVLKYWGKLLGLYKTKVYRDLDLNSDSVSSSKPNSGYNQQTVIKRMDGLPAFGSPRPLSSPAPISPVHFVPYQSQYMYLYPPVSSQYQVVNRFDSDIAKRANIDASNYHLAYRRIN